MTQLRHVQDCLDAAERRIRQLEEQLAAAQEQILLLATESDGAARSRRSALSTGHSADNPHL
jgi:hypothetical protein